MLKQWWKDVKHIPAIDTRWLAVWLLIYVDFIVLDMYFPGFWGSSVLKYTGIFLCTIYAYQKYRKDTTLFLALFLTFLSDTILVWTDWELIGVPHRVTIGDRGLKEGVVEYQGRRDAEAAKLPVGEILGHVLARLDQA